MTYIVELTAMKKHLEVNERKNVFYNETKARLYAMGVAREYNLEDKSTFGNCEFGGIGFDYRLTVTPTEE